MTTYPTEPVPSEALASLDALFHPSSVAVAGAGTNPLSMGARLLQLIRSFGFKGPLFAINEEGAPCDGVAGYRRVSDVSEQVDLCLIAVPKHAVVSVVTDCARARIPVAQITTSGFAGTGLERDEARAVLLRAAGGITRLLGPNCLGTYSPAGGLTFIEGADPEPGDIALISHSGGLAGEMVVQARSNGLRLSKVTTIGNCFDIDASDVLEYLIGDVHTSAIGIYMEGLTNGRRFLRTLSAATARKPVVILKGGRTAGGRESAASHTGALLPDFLVWSQAVADAGAHQVRSVDELLATLTVFQRSVPRPKGRAVALVGNGGGASVLATDLLTEMGLGLAKLGGQTVRHLDDCLVPPGSKLGNPTDIPAGALSNLGNDTLVRVVGLLARDHNVNALVAHLNLIPFVNYADPIAIGSAVVNALGEASGCGKPVLVALRTSYDERVLSIRRQVVAEAQRRGLLCFDGVDRALQAIQAAVTLESRRGTATIATEGQLPPAATSTIDGLVRRARARDELALSQRESLELLDAVELRYPTTLFASSEGEAVNAANDIGYPVAVKVDSPHILHKTDSDGVRLGLTTPVDVAAAFRSVIGNAAREQVSPDRCGVLVQAMVEQPVAELIIGAKRDEVFGPVLVVGIGGVFVELIMDTSPAVAPITRHQARDMWRRLRAAPVLTGYRRRLRGDVVALEDALVKVGAIANENSDLAEIDLNPVFVMPEGKGIQIVDCRVVLTR